MFLLLGAIAVLGFAADDSRVAYVETGESEGKGEPFAKLHIVDVAKSSDRVSTFEGDDAEKQALKAADGALKVFKLTEWVKPKPITPDEKGALSKPGGEPVGNLVVKTKKAKGAECDQGFQPRTLDLTLYLMDDDTPVKAGSAKAACRDECKVDSVYASHKKAALFLIKCSAPGFEGKAEVIAPFAKLLTPYGLDEDLPPQ
jgi:predicted secreted protein